MYFYHNNDLAWLKIAKNACSSWEEQFEALGWQYEDLHYPRVSLDNLKFFGFLRNPDHRHTMGTVEYLLRTKQTDLVNHPQYQKLLASAVFDEHNYAVWQQVPQHILDRAVFFIIDHEYYNYEQLTQEFLRQNNVAISVPIPRFNSGVVERHQLRQQVNAIKQRYPELTGKLDKNFLAPDQLLYARHVQLQHLWDNNA